MLQSSFGTRKAPSSFESSSSSSSSSGSHLPRVPWTDLALRRHLGKGAFGDVALMAWASRGLSVAVKCNGVSCKDGAAIDNERRLYELLLTNPHGNILPVYAICIDAPDGKVRLVMRFCEKGSLDSFLEEARHEVGDRGSPGCRSLADGRCPVPRGRPPPPPLPPSHTVALLGCTTTAQGGLTLAQVLSILEQAVAGLLHLHSLGILHRDLRAANLLIDSLDPLRVLVADFGTSHRLSAFEGPGDAGMAAGLHADKVSTVLSGEMAVGPIQVGYLDDT